MQKHLIYFLTLLAHHSAIADDMGWRVLHASILGGANTRQAYEFDFKARIMESDVTTKGRKILRIATEGTAGYTTEQGFHREGAGDFWINCTVLGTTTYLDPTDDSAYNPAQTGTPEDAVLREFCRRGKSTSTKKRR